MTNNKRDKTLELKELKDSDKEEVKPRAYRNRNSSESIQLDDNSI